MRRRGGIWLDEPQVGEGTPGQTAASCHSSDEHQAHDLPFKHTILNMTYALFCLE